MRRYLSFDKVEATQCRELLNKASVEWLDGKENISVSVNKDAEFTRVWWFGTDSDAFQCRYYLDWFCDAKNNTPQKWVDDPQIGDTVIPGRWRQAFTNIVERRNERNDTEYGVIQTMRQGWATTIDFTEARLNRERDLPGNTTGSGNEQSDDPEKWIWVDFPNFDPGSINAALDSVADTLNNVTVEGNSFGNNWHKVVGEQNRQTDGSSIITLKLARPQYTLDAFRNYNSTGAYTARYLWNVPKDLAQTIIDDANNVVTGASCVPTYRGELVDIVIFKNTLDNLEARYDSLESVLLTQDTVIYDNKSTPLDAPADSQGNIYRASNSFSSGGGYNARLTYDASYNENAEFRNLTTAFKTGRAILYKNSRSVITAPAASGSGIYRVQQNMNMDGTYDGFLFYVEGNDQGLYEFYSLKSHLSDVVTSIYKEQSGPVDAPEDGQGAIYRASNQITDDGLYNSTQLYTVSIPDGLYVSWPTRFGTAESWLYRNQRTFPDLSTPLDATTNNSVTHQVNNDGTYDVRVMKMPHAGTGATDFWNDYRTYWRYRNTNLEEDICTYVYQTRNLETAEKHLAQAWENAADNDKIIGSTMNAAGRGRFQALYRAIIPL